MRTTHRITPIVIVFSLALTACSGATLHQRAVEHNARAVELIEAGSLRQARASLEVALEYNARFSEAHANLGLIDIREGRFEEAEARLHRAVILNPDFAEAWTNLAGISLHRGLAEEAQVQAQQAVEVDPDFPEARIVLIRALLLRGIVEEAADHAERLLAVRPEEARSHAILAMVALSRGHLDEAARDVERALAIDEGLPLAIEVRGRLRLVSGDPRGAAADLEALLSEYPAGAEDPDLRYFHGLALLQAEEADAAQEAFQRVLRRRPHHGQALTALALIMTARGDHDRARSLIAAALMAEPDLPEALAIRQRLRENSIPERSAVSRSQPLLE